MKRALALAYGVLAYLGFLVVFASLVDFVADVGVVRAMDSGAVSPASVAVPVDVALVALFGASHSVMARPSFKAAWTRVVPSVIERSTYVLVADAVLALTVWQWRALPTVVWSIEPPIARIVVWGLFALGVTVVAYSTFLTDHFDLFGLRQVWLFARNRPYAPPPFQERGLYRRVRHPMMIGILVLLWAAPSMSVGHLAFALGMSGYIAVGIFFEERDLARALGAAYDDYRRRVRALIPIRRPRPTVQKS